MTNVARRVRRILSGMRALPPEERIFPGYISFAQDTRPAWWKDNIAPEAWGKIHGVHEYAPDVRAGAIVVTEMGVAVLGEGNEVSWVPYTEVAGWEKLSKDPVSMSLHVRTKSGERVEFKFPIAGQAFTFVQFLSGAMWEHMHGRTDE